MGCAAAGSVLHYLKRLQSTPAGGRAGGQRHVCPVWVAPEVFSLVPLDPITLLHPSHTPASHQSERYLLYQMLWIPPPPFSSQLLRECWDLVKPSRHFFRTVAAPSSLCPAVPLPVLGIYRDPRSPTHQSRRSFAPAGLSRRCTAEFCCALISG